jgi:hypothetical protein
MSACAELLEYVAWRQSCISSPNFDLSCRRCSFVTIIPIWQAPVTHLLSSRYLEAPVSRDGSVGIATATGWTARIWFPEGACILVFSKTHIPDLDPTQPPIQCVLMLRRPGSEAHNSLQSSAEVRNGGATTPIPHTSSWRSYTQGRLLPFYLETPQTTRLQAAAHLAYL